MKGVAIPYIIAILLGIVIIGLIGFWLFRTTGIFGTKGVESGCRERFLKWCFDWTASGYMDDWLTTSSKFFNGIAANKECRPYKLPGTDADTCTSPCDSTTVKKTCFIPT